MSKKRPTKPKEAADGKASRGEYRSIYVALVDDPDFQDLSAEARSIFFVLKLKLGVSGIGVFMVETLPRYTGNPFERVSEGVSELVDKGWLKVERNVFWLRNGLRFDPFSPLASPNQRTSIEKYTATLPKLAIVNEFARYYGLDEPFETGPKTEPIGKGSERVSEVFRNTDNGELITESKDETEDKSSEAVPRELNALDGTGGDADDPAPPPPNSDDGTPGESPPDADDVPPGSDEAEARAVLAPLIRDHLWLDTRPPRQVLASNPKWNMGRDLSIALGFLRRGEVMLEEMAGAIQHARRALHFGAKDPLSMLIFNTKDRRDRLNDSIALWRREETRKRVGAPTPIGDHVDAALAIARGGGRAK